MKNELLKGKDLKDVINSKKHPTTLKKEVEEIIYNEENDRAWEIHKNIEDIIINYRKQINNGKASELDIFIMMKNLKLLGELIDICSENNPHIALETSKYLINSTIANL